MGAFAAGDVVLVRFPFSDVAAWKLRPAVLLAHASRGEWVLCQVTSKARADPRAIPLLDADFASGSLQASSYARPAKLFTADESAFERTVAVLTTDLLDRIIDAVIAVLRQPRS